MILSAVTIRVSLYNSVCYDDAYLYTSLLQTSFRRTFLYQGQEGDEEAR